MKKHNFSHKTQPFEHQINAITEIEGDHPVALFDEQGLGKTKMVIAGLLEDIKNGFIDCALIVCKKTLLKTWENEIEMHSHLRYIKLTGTSSARKKYFTTFSHFYIINYESLIQEEEIILELLQIKKFAIVLDESHKIKNPSSAITRAIMRIKDYSKKNIIITGTPVANRPEDLWSQLYFLDNGSLLGKDFKEFKKEYGIDISMGKNIIKKENLKRLQQKIKDFSIRRTKKVAAPYLPSKRFIYEFVELNGKQKDMYNSLRRELYVEIKKMNGETVQDEAENILKRLLRLTQIASNPYLIDLNYKEEPIKFKKVDEIVKKIIERDEKVIIWTSFVNNIILLKRRYQKYNSLTLFGKMKIIDRDRVVKWFQEDPDYKVLIANPAAAKEGLTLTAANNALYVDRTFNMVDYLQSQDRIHRISQKKQCNIIIVLAKNTVDEYVDEILMKKHEIAKLIQGDSEDITYSKKLLTKEKLLSILGGKKNDR
jgi:SNF2 family DNA or RNA helicase